jgi:hypothetical protein
MIDINSLTLGEVAKVEDLSGLPIAAFGNEDKPKGLALAALSFVWKRRSEPTFTWNSAQALTIAEANEILGISDDEDDEPDVIEHPETGEHDDPFGSTDSMNGEPS